MSFNGRHLHIYEDAGLSARMFTSTEGEDGNLMDVWCNQPGPLTGKGDVNFKQWFEPVIARLSADRPLCVITQMGGAQYVSFYHPVADEAPEPPPPENNENKQT